MTRLFNYDGKSLNISIDLINLEFYSIITLFPNNKDYEKVFHLNNYDSARDIMRAINVQLMTMPSVNTVQIVNGKFTFL
jgi:hypothetical protein